MEKYTDWRDKGTGIAPFLPSAIKEPNLIECILYSVVLLVKVILTSPIIFLYLLTKNKLLLAVLLKVLFSWKDEVAVQGVKRSEVNPQKHYPNINVLYFANITSILDGILLTLIAQRNKVIFCVPDESTIYILNLVQLIKFIANDSLNVKEYGKEVNNLADYNDSVIYMLAEGTCSNGKSVLPFNMKQTVLDEIIESNKFDIKVIQLKVNSSLVTPLGINSTFKYIIKCLSKGINYKCRMNDVSLKPDLDLIRVSLCDGGKYKLISKTLDLNAKRKFIKEYNNYRRK
ncbi:hypothetical protein TPHA_0D03180 [Tetrapisispora phaffii CBS 4417]|uniref:Phospholipid/glycerol acyltransferase domain-containing protein n=1 Tax=Tetrapisispora phaffii (strain ATCC 24235 / CBS 4417 / NBRC 1672 / NRRL Y-8282 / UCD 70-5) TaxID=1071381 RepID=G8BSY3_TETPH|nr:hypothetical protein TPHA_0D03180 [Tetrapisispora phaffii CBS 4417]CCE62954.1 hypothetical protein TPHA_0D03180 [Tetrapisispora phaffii CBS 4417]